MARLELDGLHKQFGEVVALDRLDLALDSGEFVSILGPSGCGKTTALRIVAGFERADRGRVLVDGKDITGKPANRRDMGMVFQAYSLFPNMTAQKNVEFGLRVRGVPAEKRTRRAHQLLELVGLGPTSDRYPHQLSGGQQQRVALARALAIEPSVLLLDEPLSALDAKVRVQLRDEIRRIQTELSITTVYVTHDQEEALSVSDRVVVISKGHIEQVGTPAEIYSEPRTLFVADFIGTMNRIEGTVLSDPRGMVDHNGVAMPVGPAREIVSGSRVMVLIRPESIELEDGPVLEQPDSRLVRGQVVAQMFLGSVTRLTVRGALGDLVVDVPSVRALALGIGRGVGLRWDPAAPRILRLDEQAPSLPQEGAPAAPVRSATAS